MNLNKFSYQISFIKRIAFIYLLFTISRFVFYLFNLEHFEDLSTANLLLLLWDGLRFDTVAITYINILFILFYNLPFRFRYNQQFQNILKYLWIITNSLALFINYADVPYFDYVFERSSFKIFNEFSNEKNKLVFALNFALDFWYVLLIEIINIYLLIKVYNKINFKVNTGLKKRYFYPFNIVFLLIVITLSIGGVRGGFAHSTRPISVSDAGKYVKNQKQLAIVLNTPFTMMKTFDTFQYKKLNYYSDLELEKIYSPIHGAKDSAIFSNKNVVIFILESFSKEFIGSLNKELDNGEYKGYTPFLDSLIQHSLTFKTSMANGRKSIEAMPSILSSIPSINYPFILSPYYSNNLPSLPKTLKEKGYNTSFFHGAPNGSMGFQSYANMIGIENYYGKTEYNNDDDFDGMWGIWDEKFFQYFQKELSNIKQPFFSTLFSISSHHPFKIPSEYEGKFTYKDHPLQMCISYTDYSLMKFFNEAKKQEWFNNTIFIITADHASGNHREEFKNDYGDYNVPIIFYSPEGDLKNEISDRLAQQIDIMPTVLDYLGYSNEYFSFGNSLLKDKNDKFILNYRNDVIRIILGDYFLIKRNNKPSALYNFKDDQSLQNNIIDSNRDISDSLNNYSNAFLQQYQNRMIDNKLEVKN